VLVVYNTKEGVLPQIEQEARARDEELTDETIEETELTLHKETTMNALNVLYRDTTAAAAAIVITLVVSLSFVQSTAKAPAWHTVETAAVTTVQAPKLEIAAS
jgi:hypothetical protein